GPPVVVVGGCDSGGNGGAMRRARRGRLPLGSTDVGVAIHPHLPERPGLGGGPLDGVVAIVAVVPEGVELALGCITSTRVLDHHRIATLGGFERIDMCKE